MFSLHPISSSNCKDCGKTICYGLKNESTIYKVYVECSECGKDYGKAGVIRKEEITSSDQKHEKAEEKARRVI